MLDKNIHIANIQRIGKSLEQKGFLSYYMSFQGNENIFYLKQDFIDRFGEKFLKCVVEGTQIPTQAMLSQCPEILGYRGLPSGTVANVSALELIKEHSPILTSILSVPYKIDDKDNRELFGNALLYHVIRGNQDVVVAMLKRYPSLLLYRGNVVDYSERALKGVTAFELAIWALDVRHMAPAMLKCLTENEDGKDYRKELAPELQRQFDNVVKKGGGVNYTIGCGLLKMSQDPSIAPADETLVQKGTRLNKLSRLFNRHNALIQYHNRLFYFHNHHCPKDLQEITDSNAIQALLEMLNKEDRNLEEDQLQITHLEDELNIIEQKTPNSRHIFKENHYDFGFLIRALDTCVHSFDPGNAWNSDALIAHWCSLVGLAQHFAPAHVAQHYCNPDESFDPTGASTPPTFKERALKRVLHFDTTTGNARSWWSSPTLAASSSGLGLDFGIMREEAGPEGLICAKKRISYLGQPSYPRAKPYSIDLAAVTALCEVRKSELTELGDKLDSLCNPKLRRAGCSHPPNSPMI